MVSGAMQALHHTSCVSPICSEMRRRRSLTERVGDPLADLLKAILSKEREEPDGHECTDPT